MYAVLKAVPPKAALLLVGDVDQLSSVVPGQVLGDIIDSGAIPCRG
jgi:exodeoxyribonuclease V alpha subunit